MVVKTRSRIAAGSRLSPISADEVDFLGEELSDLYKGIKKYGTRHGLTHEGEKVDAVTHFYSDGSTETLLDEGVDNDEGTRVAAYVHEQIHKLRGITGKNDEWIVDDYLTPKALLALYGHKDPKVRQMAENGYRAWETRNLMKTDFTMDNDGITDEQFNEYFMPGAAVTQTAEEEFDPKQFQKMGYKAFIKKLKGDEDPDVAKELKYAKMDPKERELRKKLESVNKELADAEKEYKDKIAAIDSEEDRSKSYKNAAIDMGTGVMGWFESAFKGLLDKPFEFVRNYSGKSINLEIGSDSKMSEGLRGLLKEGVGYSFKDGQSGRKTHEESAYKSRVSELKKEKGRVVGELVGFIMGKEAPAVVVKPAATEGLWGYEKYGTRLTPEEMAELEKYIVTEDPYETRLTPEEMAELEKYVVIEKAEAGDAREKEVKEWDINGLPHYKLKNGKYEKDEIDALADMLVDAIFGKRED